MPLERNLSLTSMEEGITQRQSCVAELISVGKGIGILSSCERTANQTNQVEWQSLVALFCALRLAFLPAVNIAS